MKYVRTHETRDKFLADKDSTSRGFRLAPTLYKYSDESEDEDNRDHIYLELDDPRKHEGSTYMEIALDSDVEFSFYIGNKSGDNQTTMTCTVDWGDDTIETMTIAKDTYGFKLAHNYVAGSYKIELYDVERDYVIVGSYKDTKSFISHPSSVKRVVLGEGVVDIGYYAFGGCSSLTSIYIPEGATHIANAITANCSSLTSIYIPKSITYIGSSMFLRCISLSSIYIPKSVVEIGTDAFDSCRSLKSIYIPDGVTYIGYYAFQYCRSLTSIHIPKGVTTINQYAFSKCTSLKSIDIPERVTSIEDSVFEGCSSLTSISSFNPTTPTLGGNIFLNLPTNGTLHIKPGATGYDAWLSKLPEGWRIVEDL